MPAKQPAGLLAKTANEGVFMLRRALFVRMLDARLDLFRTELLAGER